MAGTETRRSPSPIALCDAVKHVRKGMIRRMVVATSPRPTAAIGIEIEIEIEIQIEIQIEIEIEIQRRF